MPETDDNLYQRGRYKLAWDRKQDGSLRSPFLQIVWYDEQARRIRQRSTGSAEVQPSIDALDRLYLEREKGQASCPTCGRPFEGNRGQLVTDAIADYLLLKEDVASIGALRPRLAHVLDYIDSLGIAKTLRCDQVDEDWISKFRAWAKSVPIISPKMKHRKTRSSGTIEGSVRALQSAINTAFRRQQTLHPAAFTPKKAQVVSVTPLYRADVKVFAQMFSYALERNSKGKFYPGRQALLRFLQASIATWGRPDAIYDLSTSPDRRQWISQANVVQLNPVGREQTRKYRASVPVPKRFASLLDACEGYFVPVSSVRSAFNRMLDKLGLPRDGETGEKLIRRSISHIVRRRIGEEHWVQGEMMLGHRKASTSDLYALPDPANLGRAAKATADVIEEIEALVPGAFSRYNTGLAPEIMEVPRETKA